MLHCQTALLSNKKKITKNLVSSHIVDRQDKNIGRKCSAQWRRIKPVTYLMILLIINGDYK